MSNKLLLYFNKQCFMLTTTMLKLFDNIVPLQAEENETPHREPAGWPSKGKI